MLSLVPQKAQRPSYVPDSRICLEAKGCFPLLLITLEKNDSRSSDRVSLFQFQYFTLQLDSSLNQEIDSNLKIQVDSNFPPYRRLFAWRIRKGLLEHGCQMEDKGDALLTLSKFSEVSRSIQGAEEDDTEV